MTRYRLPPQATVNQSPESFVWGHRHYLDSCHSSTDLAWGPVNWEAQPFSPCEPNVVESFPTVKKLDLRKDLHGPRPATLPLSRHPLGPLWCPAGVLAWEGAGPTEALEQSQYRSELKVWGEAARLWKAFTSSLRGKVAVFTNPTLPCPHQQPDGGREAKFSQSSNCDIASQAPRTTWVRAWGILKEKHRGPCSGMSLWLKCAVYVKIFFLTIILICWMPRKKITPFSVPLLHLFIVFNDGLFLLIFLKNSFF